MSGTVVFTPVDGTQISPGDSIKVRWSGYAGFPTFAYFYVTTAYGEELAYTWNLVGDDILGEDFALVDFDFSSEVTLELKRIGGWNAPDGKVTVRFKYQTVVPTTDTTAYATLDVSPILEQPNTAHTEEGQSLLLSQFQGKPDTEAFLAAYLDQVQDLEDGLVPIIASRSIDIAVGVSLDILGAILNMPRAGLTDDNYRLRLRAEIAINNSDGTQYDLINVTQLLLGMLTKDVQYDEYFPKAVYLRPRNHLVDEDPDVILTLLKRTAPAGTEVHFVYSEVETDDDDMFRFSDTADTTETSSTHGTENGSLCGAD